MLIYQPGDFIVISYDVSYLFISFIKLEQEHGCSKDRELFLRNNFIRGQHKLPEWKRKLSFEKI